MKHIALRLSALAAAAVLCGATVVLAQAAKTDVTGKWTFTVETGAGSGTPTMTFKQDGEKLTGQYKGLLGEAALTGTVKENAIEFSFKVSGDVEGTLVYTGTVDGDTAKGKVKFAELGDGTWSGKKRK